jgi:tetratricopeptide (TPR) repeat protein
MAGKWDKTGNMLHNGSIKARVVAATALFVCLGLAESCPVQSQMQYPTLLAPNAAGANRDPQLAHAAELRRRRDFKGAIAAYTSIIAQNPRNEKAYTERAAIYYSDTSQYEAAIADATMATKLNPNDPKPWDIIGNSYLMLDEPDKAVAALTKAINLYQAQASAQTNQITKGYLDRHPGSIERKAFYETLAKTAVDFQTADCYQTRGRAYASMNQNKQALSDFDQAIACGARQAPIGDWLADRDCLLARMNEKDRLISDWPRLRNSPLHYPIDMAARSSIATYLGYTTDAEKDLAAYYQHKAEDACDYNNRALVYVNHGEWDKALSDLKQSVRMTPVHAEHFARAAMVESRLGHEEAAKVHATTAVAVASKVLQKSPNNSRALLSRALASIQLGAHNNAISDCKKVIAAEPANEDAYQLMGDAYCKLGDLQNGLKNYTASLDLTDFDRGQSFFKRGKLFDQLGRTEEAAKDYKRAAELGYKEASQAADRAADTPSAAAPPTETPDSSKAAPNEPAKDDAAKVQMNKPD